MDTIAVCGHKGTTAFVRPILWVIFPQELLQWYVLLQNANFFLACTSGFLGAATGSPCIVFISSNFGQKRRALLGFDLRV